MSIEEDIELRDLLAQTLESNGSLAKIRAQLRASVFLALEEDIKVSKKEPLLNEKLKSYQKTAQGKAMFCIVREFMDFFNLDFTISVYEPESYSGTGYKYEGRQKLIDDLGINSLETNCADPLLLQIIDIAQKTKYMDISNSSSVSAENVSNGEINVTNAPLNKFAQDENISKKIKTDSTISNLSTNVITEGDVFKQSLLSSNGIKSKQEKLGKIDLEIDIPRVNLNSTFDLSSSTFDKTETHLNHMNESNGRFHDNHIELASDNETSPNKKQDEKDDTFEGTSLITEDGISCNNNENSIDPERNQPSSIEKLSNNPTQNGVFNEPEAMTPVLREKSRYDLEKPKVSSQRPEKHKSKNNLSSLSDLPPLPLGKSRVSDILPSLYNKEFKERSNLKELDEMFDMEADYEEDFMSGSEIDLTLSKSEHSQTNLDDRKIRTTSGNSLEATQETNNTVDPDKGKTSDSDVSNDTSYVNETSENS